QYLPFRPRMCGQWIDTTCVAKLVIACLTRWGLDLRRCIRISEAPRLCHPEVLRRIWPAMRRWLDASESGANPSMTVGDVCDVGGAIPHTHTRFLLSPKPSRW